MTYTEKELDQFLHGISLSLLSKKSAQHWRYDEETAKEIEWLEVLERKVRADKADRKTEPTHDLRTETHECVKDTHDKDEPTISKMEQVEQRSCDTCKNRDVEGWKNPCLGCTGFAFYEPKDEPQYDAEEVAKDINRRVDMVKKEWNARHMDEPQTEPLHTCSVNGRPYNECSSCEHFKCTADEPQTDCPWK